MREILFVAGEASGDLHGAGVARALGEMGAPFSLAGIGGDRMRDAGVTLLAHVEKLAVMGFVEVLKHVPLHYRLANELRRRIRSGNVAVVVLIDYPGFNMKLAAAAAAAGVPVLYYITPQVWAWGAGRLSELARIVTRAATILPFEESLLRSHGINATFVGHPLFDEIVISPSPGTPGEFSTRVEYRAREYRYHFPRATFGSTSLMFGLGGGFMPWPM